MDLFPPKKPILTFVSNLGVEKIRVCKFILGMVSGLLRDNYVI